MIVAHITHEAVENIGGIGTVIAGLVTAEAYRKKVSRSFLIGPKFAGEKTLSDRLGPHGEVLYCRADGKVGGEYERIIRPIEERYNCEIDFGRRLIIEPYSGKSELIDVILVDVSLVNIEKLNNFKLRLYENFGVSSEKFENIWEYEQYVRLAEPACDALRALINGARNPVVILGHEFMGMPTVLKAKLDMPESRAYFHAHEVASVRPVVEKRSGHDTMFYNVMCAARRKGLTLEEVFEEVSVNFKHLLVKAAKYCNGVLAVGDFVREELEFMSGDFTESNVHLVYNGIPHNHVTLDDKMQSRTMLCDYSRKLLGYCPTWVFSHVARPVLSKGIWRDLRVMHELDALLQQRGETAVYFMLGTLGGTRRPADVLRMEKDYDWPVKHAQGYPDLCGGEDVISDNIEAFNAGHQAIRAILINQWGFSRQACGERMDSGTSIADLRRGCDVEFGMSVYEPFGISQLEGLTYGALSIISNVCGCAGFVKLTEQDQPAGNVIIGDFVRQKDIADEICKNFPDNSVQTLLLLDRERRDEIEKIEGRRIAQQIDSLLPRSLGAQQQMLESGFELADRMSWERVVSEMLMPVIAD